MGGKIEVECVRCAPQLERMRWADDGKEVEDMTLEGRLGDAEC